MAISGPPTLMLKEMSAAWAPEAAWNRTTANATAINFLMVPPNLVTCSHAADQSEMGCQCVKELEKSAETRGGTCQGAKRVLLFELFP